LNLQNFEVYYLPPNTTSKIPTLDDGIIAAFKLKYRRQHIRYLLKCCESNLLKKPTINLLTAIRYVVISWYEISEET